MTDEQKPQSKSGESGNTTHDLRKDAELALQMMRQEQANAARQHDEQPPEASEPDVTHPDELPPDYVGNTTYDLMKEARKAMELMGYDPENPEASTAKQRQSQTPQTEASDDQDEQGHPFPQGTQVRLDVDGATDPVILNIAEEALIGRCDNVTNFMPDVDLTPFGAYRLGLSRRHALLRRQENRLQLVDLGSRNGTTLNGTKMDKNAVKMLNDGDEIQLGNLTLKLSFLQRDG